MNQCLAPTIEISMFSRHVKNYLSTQYTKRKLSSMTEHIPILDMHNSIDLAFAFLEKGSVIALPTDTVYGLACDATNQEAVRSLYHIKRRNEHKPVAICLGQMSDIGHWANIEHLPKCLLDSLLPGPVTIILPGTRKMHDSLCSCQGKVAIRIPDCTFIRSLAARMGRPLALSSANLSNEPSALYPAEFKAIWDRIPAIFDGGAISAKGVPSTVVDLTEKDSYRFVRRGASFYDILAALNRSGLSEQ